MAIDTFADTSGLYAVMASGDPAHPTAAEVLEQALRAERRLFTSDYVLDETATLLSAHGLRACVGTFLDTIFSSSAITVLWCDRERFHRAAKHFAKHNDKHWSFTDCLSFVLMEELGLHEALTTDRHFKQAGFSILL
ncbi:MAG: PIN domain-containing protein [Salinisphaera sp.]|nr:PIN domain-containing protein [Salinisphaera sp.]